MWDERRLLFSDELSAREALLASRGLTVPGNEDIILGIFEQSRLIAVGALVGDIIQGVAVDVGHEGEGLAARIVGSLIRYAADKGLWHIFLFTKAEEARLFSDLGFSEVAATPEAALLEWGKPDVEDYRRFLKDKRAGVAPGASCVVMNCNPFTLGHRHLIETAVSQSRHLFVLAVEEDLSEFPFQIRLRLIREGTADLENVTVIAGGRYIVSSATFPSYFTHERRHAAVHARLDAELFLRHIVPALGIARRFVGQEPFSPVTGIYNQVMKSVLPERGVDLVEIPRLEINGEPVSASRVRRLIAEGRLDETKPLVPEATWRCLVSSQEIPDAREARWTRRLELCSGGSLLTLTMNVPGPDKNPPRWNALHDELTQTIKKDLEADLLFFEKRRTAAGAESHFVTDLTPQELKKYACFEIEEKHPAGRLADADVMDSSGTVWDRQSLNLPARPCFCCGRPAKECLREGRHSLEELLERAEETLDFWERRR